jgi:hypothetical protein
VKRSWRGVCGVEEGLGDRHHILQYRQILRIYEGSPLLQGNNDFENTVSRLMRKFPLNYEFVASGPESPTLSCEKHPKKSV